jgi:hypothetical protein
MKLVTQSNARFSSLKIQLILLFVTINTFAQTFDPDDLPPEFGLGDDPEPGAPIDLMVPVVIAIMLVSMFIYYKKTKHKEV